MPPSRVLVRWLDSRSQRILEPTGVEGALSVADVYPLVYMKRIWIIPMGTHACPEAEQKDPNQSSEPQRTSMGGPQRSHLRGQRL